MSLRRAWQLLSRRRMSFPVGACRLWPIGCRNLVCREQAELLRYDSCFTSSQGFCFGRERERHFRADNDDLSPHASEWEGCCEMLRAQKAIPLLSVLFSVSCFGYRPLFCPQLFALFSATSNQPTAVLRQQEHENMYCNGKDSYSL